MNAASSPETDAERTAEPASCPPSIRQLRDRVAQFVTRSVIPRESELDAGGPAAARILAGLRQQATAEGLWALPLPVHLGGQGLPLTSYVHIAEAEGASDHGPAALGSATLLDVLMLHRHASPRVRARYVAPLAAGRIRSAYAMTEPDVPGSDPLLTAAVATADPADGSWTLSGRKWFTTAAAEADFVTVLARTDGEPGSRHGLSLLLVPTDSPGFRVVRELPVLGVGGQWDIELEGVRVPADHLIGERGDALAVAGERLQLGRTLRCLRWLGQAERAFALMRTRARERALRRGPLGDHQLVQQHVFEALLAIRSTRPLVHQAARLIEAGRDAHIEVGLAKVAAARMLQQVADAAIQVHGAAGLGPDTPLPGLFRMGRMARILDGPDELHIASVARRVLRAV